MIVIKVELWSAVSGEKTELARMEITNDATHTARTKGNYTVRTLRGRSARDLDKRVPQREATVKNWPRAALHVWNLVAESLAQMGYGNPGSRFEGEETHD